MRRFWMVCVGIVAGVLMSTGVAVAAGTFDSSTPPSFTAPWMNRPCKSELQSQPLLKNCYWNNTMGLTNANGNHTDTGFWIRKIPHQPLICYLHSPDDEYSVTEDKCFPTADSKRRFTHIMYNAFFN